jgi:hypothetical protein
MYWPAYTFNELVYDTHLGLNSHARNSYSGFSILLGFEFSGGVETTWHLQSLRQNGSGYDRC